MSTTISSLNVVLKATVAPFVKGFARAGGAARQLESQLGGTMSMSLQTSQTLSTTGSVAGRAGGMFKGLARTIIRVTAVSAVFGAVWGAIRSAVGGFELAVSIEQTGVAMEALLKSAGQAKALMGDLVQFAIKTPFRFDEVAKGAKRLLATGSAAADVIDEMRMLGDIASGTGSQLGDLIGIYGKIQNRGRISGIELRQMGLHSIPIYEELAKVLGVDTSQIDTMVSTGKVGFSAVQQAFRNLTSEGGRFAGLMDKQSKTLGGLWSNLMDAIGLNAVRVILKLSDLFHLKDALNALITGASALGTWVVDAANRYGALIVAGVSSVWGVIVEIWDAGVAIVMPIVASVTNFITNNWREILTATVEVWSALSGYLVTVVTTVWQVVTEAASGLVIIWDWAMAELGMQSLQWGNKTTTTAQKIVGIFKWVADAISLFYNATAFTIKNWQLVFTIAALYVGYEIVKLGNQIGYILTVVIPGYQDWFDRNWRQVWATIANFTSTVFDNLLTNAENFATALWDAITGKDFEFDWKPLTEGFKSALTELPQIAAREIPALEAGLYSMIQDSESQFGEGLAGALSANAALAKSQAEDVISGVDDVIAKFTEAADAADAIDIPDFLEDKEQKPDVLKQDKAKRKSRQSRDSNDLVRAGGARAQQLHFQGMFAGRQTMTAEDLLKKGNDLQQQGNDKLDDINDNLEDDGGDVEEGVF